MDSKNLAIGVAWYVAFVFSTVVHEASHALAARLGGDRTSDSQVTLDPLPHMTREPFGMVVVPWLMFILNGSMMGWASTPFDPTWAARYPRRAAWMALAGPFSNLLLAVISGGILRVGLAHHWFAGDMNGEAAVQLIFIFFQLNVILFVLNLLPCPPLDGAAAVTLAMPERAAQRWREAVSSPQISMLTLLLVWMVFPKVASPVLGWAVELLRP